MARRIFVEGHGCSANLAEADQISSLVQEEGKLVLSPAEADAIVIHSCGVKKATEFKLKRRIQQFRIQNPSAQIVVSGCLPRINPQLLASEHNLVQLGTRLEEIADTLALSPQSFSPDLSFFSKSPVVSTLVIGTGCLSNCSFCGTKLAKGQLKSFSPIALQKRFESDLALGKKEFWLASQDNGCYGFDRNTTLPELVRALLDAGGERDFRIRIGMLSPQYLDRFLDAFIALFEDNRVYRFVHLPIQSGNNRVLKDMRRAYSMEAVEAWVKELRQKIPDFSFSTDMITGFPTETEAAFEDSVTAMERLKPDVVNISRYGLRPNTSAALLPQLADRVKTERSRRLLRVCRNLFLEKNRGLVGKEETVLFSQLAKVNGVVGRTRSYRPVVVPFEELGIVKRVRLTVAFPTFFKGLVLEASNPQPALC